MALRFNGNVGDELRVVAVLPVDFFVELLEVELAALFAAQQIAPPVAIFHEGFNVLKTFFEVTTVFFEGVDFPEMAISVIALLTIFHIYVII